MKKTRAEKVGMIINGLLLLLITFITIYPFWHVLMYSISNSQAASSGGLFFIPRELNLLGYRMVLKQPQLYIAYWNTIARTGVGTLISVILTAMLAFQARVNVEQEKDKRYPYQINFTQAVSKMKDTIVGYGKKSYFCFA